MKTNHTKLGLLAILAGSMAASTMAAGFFWDNFESYSVGTSLTALSAQGWGASDASVMVTNNVFGNPTNMVALPPNTVLTNTVGMAPGASGKIWTDCLIDETVRVDPACLPLVESNTVVMAGVTTDGFAVVYNTASNGWDICTNDARGSAVAGLSAGAWAQLSLCEDFARNQVALFLNGRLLRQGVPFITNQTSYAKLTFSSGVASAGYVDNVYVSNAVPATLAGQALSSTSDINGDGVVDAVEIMQYGTLTKMVPGDYATITGALAAAQAGDRIAVSGGTYAESLVVSNNVTLVGTNVTGVAGVTVLSNRTMVLSGFTSFAITNLVIQSGGILQVSNSTLTANGMTLTGTFTLDSGWGGSLTPSSLNYTNDFESYALNMPLTLCGGQGWGSSDSGSVIQGLVFTNGAKAVLEVPRSTLSNVVSAVGITKVWTDVWLNDSAVKYAGFTYPDTNANLAVMVFMNTDNHVVIWNSNAWDVCALDVAGNAAPTVSTGQWVRVSVFEDFSAQKAALFVNGQLLRQQVPFVSPVASYQGLSLSSGDGAAYMDDVKIWTQLPANMTSDLDRDGIPDALEIDRYGTLTPMPRGVTYSFR